MRKITSFALILLLCGCNLEPPYRPPPLQIPREWKTEELQEKKIITGPKWWHAFADPLLTSLEERAIKANQNVYIALQKIAEARAVADVDLSELYPHLSLNPNYLNWAQLYKLIFPVPLPIPQYFRAHQVQYEIPLNLSWELDLFGKIRSQYKSAKLNTIAQIDNLFYVLLTLTTDLGAAYFQLRALDTQIDLVREKIAVDRKEVELVQERFQKGLVGLIDLEEAKLVLTNEESTYYDIVRQRRIQENKIAVFLALPASCFSLPHNPLKEDPPAIAAGIPSKVLCRRPDVREQERLMASEHALLGVAYASFFPSVSLTGALGTLSPDLKSFFTWNSRYWSYGANASQSVFDAGKNCANLEASWARFYQASGSYKQVVLTAFQEVEDALNNIEMQKKQAISLRESFQAAIKIEELARRRYNQGLTGYLDLMNAEQNALTAEIDYANLQGIRFLSTMQLIKSIGGWY